MVFAPQNSMVKEIYSQIPAWLKRFPITPAMWSPELQKLEGHTGGVNAVAFSQDGSLYRQTSHKLSPRLGMAWTPEGLHGKTVVRAGFATFVQPITISQLSIAGGNLNIGGPSTVPLVRGDTTFVAADTFSWLHGRHSLKFGGEYRKFLSNTRRLGPGIFNFASIPEFLAGNANSFSIILGNQSSSIDQGAFESFLQTNYRWTPHLTIQLGLRYAWNMTPKERFGRFIVFGPESASLEDAGAGDGFRHEAGD